MLLVRWWTRHSRCTSPDSADNTGGSAPPVFSRPVFSQPISAVRPVAGFCFVQQSKPREDRCPPGALVTARTGSGWICAMAQLCVALYNSVREAVPWPNQYVLYPHDFRLVAPRHVWDVGHNLDLGHLCRHRQVRQSLLRVQKGESSLGDLRRHSRSQQGASGLARLAASHLRRSANQSSVQGKILKKSTLPISPERQTLIGPMAALPRAACVRLRRATIKPGSRSRA